jgi:hypothetical protein
MSILEKRDSYAHVSDIIDVQTYRSFATTPIKQLVAGSLRGIVVENECMAFAKGSPGGNFDESYRSYINAFTSWYSENHAVLIKAKERLYDDENLFTTELDFILRLNGSEKFSLVELKTGSKFSKSWVIQLAAQYHLCQMNNIEVEVAYIVHLKKIYKKNKNIVKADAVAYTMEDLKVYWGIFKNCLACYDFFNREGALWLLKEESDA